MSYRNKPIVRYTKHCDDGTTIHRDFDPLEFLAELSLLIPNVWEQTVRYLGAYSARTRGADKDQDRVDDNDNEAQEDKPKPSSIWAMLIKRVYEVDPLICPKCNGNMKIVAFLQDPREIEKICDSLGVAASRDPPPFENKLGVHLVSEFDQSMC